MEANGEGWQREYASGLESSGDFLSWNLSLGYKPTENSFIYLAGANSQDPAAGDLALVGRNKRSIKSVNLILKKQQILSLALR